MAHIVHEVVFGSPVPSGVNLQGSFNPLKDRNKTDANGEKSKYLFFVCLCASYWLWCLLLAFCCSKLSLENVEIDLNLNLRVFYY